MPEKVLPLPLSGEEVRKAVLDRIDQSLQKDCYLSPNAAYDWFSAEIKLKLMLHDVGRTAEVEQTVAVFAGEEPEEGAEGVEGEITMEAKPPNEVRVETGQEVPVLAKSPEGKPVIKGIRYARKHAQKATKSA
jgi:hypothetical protein